jgi:hypothetical protein
MTRVRRRSDRAVFSVVIRPERRALKNNAQPMSLRTLKAINYSA